MAAFLRRFLFDPGDDVLLEIESVNILDLEPPANIQGVGTGTVCIFGEFENGPYNEPTEVSGGTDLVNTFGGFGYNYTGDPSNNPCARARKADGATSFEYWNGNGIIQLNRKKFARLIVVRVDTSIGAVNFNRLASVIGVAKFAYDLEPGQTIVTDVGGGDVVATFTAVTATVTGAGGTFAMSAGQTITLGYDLEPDFIVTFLGTDTTVAACISRINQYAGFTFATNSGGQIKLTGRIRGTSGQVRVVAASAPGVLTALGLTVANTAPLSGNVANIDKVTIAEANTVVSAANVAIRIETLSDGRPRLVNKATPLTGTVKVSASSTAIDFGFPLDVVDSAATGTAGIIPAGTRVRVSAGPQFVTTQDTTITASNAGSYSARIRHALDDGTGVSATAGSISIVESPIDIDSFEVINPLNVSAALTEIQIDTAYETAIDSTLDINSVAREINITYSARQSNIVRRKMRSNARQASAEGCFGRIACIRPPLGTLKATAKSNTAEPGVGAYRDQRVCYNYPGLATQVPGIAVKGLAGGAGFTADGVVDVGSDGFLACIMSQLPFEENPGQETPYADGAIAIESSANAKGFNITDYTQFKASGICAPRIVNAVVYFQSGCTSVNPSTDKALVNIARRRTADFFQDSISLRLQKVSKKLNQASRRRAVTASIRGFMNSYLGLTNAANQRIGGFTLDGKTLNTTITLQKGIWRILLNIQNLSSLDSIVLQTTVGETIEVDEVLPQTA